MNERKNRDRATNILLLLLAAACSVFLFWKCRYGFANCDESFYLTIPSRLLDGDHLILDEWNVTQMSSFLLVPFVWLYRLLHTGSDGMLLSFRYLFTAIQICTAFLVFLTFRKKHKLGAAAAAIVFGLYAPFGIMALSYNSLGILCLTISLLLTWQEKAGGFRCILSGFFLACAVLCCPALAAPFLLCTLFVLGRKLAKQDRGNLFRVWCFQVAGILVPAVAVTAIVLAGCPLDKLISLLPQIIADPQHPARGFFETVRTYFVSVVFATSVSKYIFAGYVLSFAGLLARKKFPKAGEFCWLLSVLLTGIFLVSFFVSDRYLNFLMLPLCLEAVFAFLHTDDPEVRRLFLHFWLPGMVFSFCVHYTSNQYLYAISSGCSVALPASVLMIAAESNLQKHRTGFSRDKIIPAAVAVLLTVQILFTGFSRFESVFWEEPMDRLTETVSCGSEKGLRVSKKYADAYAVSFADAEEIRTQYCPENILCLSESIWVYLDLPEAKIRSYSAWLYGLNQNTLPWLERYYTMPEHSLPDAVYAEQKDRRFADAFREQYGYTETMLGSGNLLLLKP